MTGKALTLVLCALSLIACANLDQTPGVAAGPGGAGAEAAAGKAAGGPGAAVNSGAAAGQGGAVASADQTGPMSPALKTYSSFGSFGVRILSAPDGLVTGPVEVLISTREKIDLLVSIVSSRTGKPAGGLAECTAGVTGWSVGAGFSESGVYTLSVFGKLQSSTKNEYSSIFDMRFTVKVDASNWTFAPSFKTLGFSVVSSPGREITGDAKVVLSQSQSEVELAYGLADRATGKTAGQVVMMKEGGNSTVTCVFPADGDYVLDLYAYRKGGQMGSRIAQGAFKVTLKESPDLSLVRAMKLSDLVLMKKALDRGADANMPMPGYIEWAADGVKKSIDGYPIFSVLRWYSAGVDARIEALKLLKSRGADFTRLTSEGSTILDAYFSVLPENSEEAVKLCKALLDLGADPRQDTSYSYYLNDVLTYAKIGTLLALEDYDYKEAGKRTALIPLLVKGGAGMTARWPGGDSGLGRLISSWSAGAKTYIKAYLEAGADPEPDDLRRLAWAVRYSTFDGDYALVSRILAGSTHVNDRDEYGSTLVHNLVGDEDLPRDVFARFFSAMAPKSPDLNASTKYGETPLMIAIEKGSLAAMDELLARGADPQRAGTLGKNVFHTIASRPMNAGTAALIDRFLALGADINARDDAGRTPVFSACESDSNLALLKLLVSKGADPAISDVDGFTAMGYAKSKGYKTLVAYFTSLKVPEASGGWPVGNAAPACKAVLEGDIAALGALPASEIEAMSARTPDGVPATPLHLAAESGSLRVIEALGARKVRWDVGDRYGRTPLEKAVLMGRADAVTAILKAGADPGRKNDWGESPLTRALASGSPLAQALLASAAKPDWEGICIPMAVASPLSLIRSVSRAGWTTYALNACSVLGRTDILELLGGSVKHESLSPAELLAEGKKSKQVFDAYAAEARAPLTAPRVEGADRKGTYTLTLKSWSPWMDVDPALTLAKYPVVVCVPKDYDGSKPYGLVISMMNAQSSNQAPSAAYVPTLERHNLIYVGFDPYNGVFENGSGDFQSTNHERLCLAVAYHMFGAYKIDRARVYLTGFSWGGRLTGEIVPKQPRIFTGGIAVGGCFITLTGGRIIASYPYARTHTAMVLATGDWDYNREETFSGYNTFLTLGYEAHYFQEPRKGHARISGESFEKAVTLLDEAAARR